MPRGLLQDQSHNPYKGLTTKGHLSSLYYFTIADTETPEVAHYVPAPAAKNGTIDTDIVLTFNEYVQAGTGAIMLTSSNGAAPMLIPVDDAQVAFLREVVTVRPAEPLEYNASYELTIVAGVIRDDLPSAGDFAGIAPTLCNATSGGKPHAVAESSYVNGSLAVTVGETFFAGSSPCID